MLLLKYSSGGATTPVADAVSQFINREGHGGRVLSYATFSCGEDPVEQFASEVFDFLFCHAEFNSHLPKCHLSAEESKVFVFLIREFPLSGRPDQG